MTPLCRHQSEWPHDDIRVKMRFVASAFVVRKISYRIDQEVSQESNSMIKEQI